MGFIDAFNIVLSGYWIHFPKFIHSHFGSCYALIKYKRAVLNLKKKEERERQQNYRREKNVNRNGFCTPTTALTETESTTTEKINLVKRNTKKGSVRKKIHAKSKG